MKLISTIIGAVLCSSSSLLAQEEAPGFTLERSVSSQKKLGSDAVIEIRRAYEAGEYDTFLSDADAEYESVKTNHKLDELSALRTHQPVDSRWIDAILPLQKEKNQKLLSLVENDDSLFAKKVKSAASDILTPEQHQALRKLSLVRQTAPGEGKTSDENRLIDLDLEYEYKALNVEIPSMQGAKASDSRVQQFALRMEMMDKMQALAASFEDADLRAAVQLAAQNFDMQMAQKWDQMDLSALAKGKVESKDPLEEKVAAILQIHVEKLQELSHSL